MGVAFPPPHQFLSEEERQQQQNLNLNQHQNQNQNRVQILHHGAVGHFLHYGRWVAKDTLVGIIGRLRP